MKQLSFVLFCLCLILLLTGCGSKSAAVAAVEPEPITSGSDGSVSIPVSRFDSGVLLIDLKSGETAMQMLAHLGSDGTPKLSWNTCSVCNGSPFAYFEYKNDQLTCKNCGNTFPVDSIGGDSAGCYPWAVSEYSVDGDKVIVPASAIAEMEPNFKNWKKGI